VSGGLSGTGTASPPATIAPLTHEFGTLFVGTSSASQTFTINNPALLPATLGPITVTAPFALLSTTCTSSLAAQSSCTADVKFSPVAVGAASGSISATISGGTVTANLSGTGSALPVATIAPANHDFGPQFVGTSSALKTFTISNPAPLPATLGPITVTAPFALVATTCTGSLAAQSSCTADVKFSPLALGAASGSVSSAISGGSISAGLLGTGTAAPLLAITPATFDFGSVLLGASSAPQSFTVKNPGPVTLSMSPLVVTGPFQLVSTTCGSVDRIPRLL
jgi:hypothetical protein